MEMDLRLLNENAKHFSHTLVFSSVRRPFQYHKMIGLNRDLTKISRIEFWRGRLVSGQAFWETEFSGSKACKTPLKFLTVKLLYHVQIF